MNSRIKTIRTGLSVFLLASALVAVNSAGAVAAVGGNSGALAASIEDMGFEASGRAPVPPRRPDFSRPGILQLLHFGQPPHPQQKPARLAESTGRLSGGDSRTYRKIFTAQAHGDWDEADRLTDTLDDRSLMGHVLFQRYMHPAYKVSFNELVDWLDLYADHPGANRVYTLGQARRPYGVFRVLKKPGTKSFNGGLLDILSEEGIGGARSSDAKLAAASMYEGNLDAALKLANESAKRSGEKAPLAGWVGGLSSWRQGKYKQAASFFELTAGSPYAPDWMASGAAYWASRSHMRAGNMNEVNRWLREAAAHPRTFYGLIATRALGWNFDFDWAMPRLTEARKKKLAAFPAGCRAMALAAAGQQHLAELELRQLDIASDKNLFEAVLAFAGEENLPSLALKLAEGRKNPQGGTYDAALYPDVPWKPEGGYRIDAALIHALIRQESRFDAFAQSDSGAVGLMQLMPATARGVMKETPQSLVSALKDPQINMNAGQLYIEALIADKTVNDSLFQIIMAYNAGPGSIPRWKSGIQGAADDPLLFIESVPVGETRTFVKRVMANYWIYSLKNNNPVPSLDAAAEGRDTRYASEDSLQSYEIAGR